MKAILLSIRPEWVAKIFNGIKKKEIRSLFPKDYVGWVYIYCTKATRKDYLVKYLNFYTIFDTDKAVVHKPLNGKVVARFWCDKVDNYVNGLNWENLQHDAASYDDYESILEPSCLTEDELYNYVNDLSFFAIHITNLEIFDKPKELSEFQIKVFPHRKSNLFTRALTKAPQNYCWIEGE